MNVPAKILFNVPEKYFPENRKWCGVPSVEKTGKRLWSAWFSGGKYEPSIDNYAVIAYSDDGGERWIDPYMIIENNTEEGYRIFDPQLWLDPNGKLWLFWVQDTYAEGTKPSDFEAKNWRGIIFVIFANGQFTAKIPRLKTLYGLSRDICGKA